VAKLNFLTLLTAAGAVLQAAQVAGEMEGVLTELAENDYDGATALVLENQYVVDFLDTQPAEDKAAIVKLLPKFLQLFDAAIPEEVLLKALHRLGIGA
jgi:hypothetical protein